MNTARAIEEINAVRKWQAVVDREDERRRRNARIIEFRRTQGYADVAYPSFQEARRRALYNPDDLWPGDPGGPPPSVTVGELQAQGLWPLSDDDLDKVAASLYELERFEGCRQCGGELEPLGSLGGVRYFRCRNCGWHQRGD